LKRIHQRDLEHILAHTEALWNDLRGGRIFITGGTGFFGKWLLESFAWANERLALKAQATVLTRNIDNLTKAAPHLTTNPSIRFHTGDIRNFDFPAGSYSHIIHAAATAAEATFNNEKPLDKFDNIVGGTRRTLDFAVHCNAQRFLFTSSGPVYGRQPEDVSHIAEDFPGTPNPNDREAVLGESKRSSEFLCHFYAAQYGFSASIARCFSFVGPHLQLDIHYAIGNFIRNALRGEPIHVNGDGTPVRSYLYAADLMIWLWTLLFRAQSQRAYNVGSEESITIGELAYLIAGLAEPPLPVLITAQPGTKTATNRYIPSTRRAQNELGLRQHMSLVESVRRTMAFHKNTSTTEVRLPIGIGS
jgi:dTDP-glucose 4,6-dehydratase